MRTGNTLKIITIILVVLAFMSATAFAFTGKPPADTTVPAGDKEEPSGDKQELAGQFWQE